MDDYIKRATSTESNDFEAIKDRVQEVQIRLMHSAMGMATESAEVLDIIKKHVFYGKKLDIAHFNEEMGDILWYIAIACDVMGVSFTDLMVSNIDKLGKRYEEGKFTENRAINR